MWNHLVIRCSGRQAFGFIIFLFLVSFLIAHSFFALAARLDDWDASSRSCSFRRLLAVGKLALGGDRSLFLWFSWPLLGGILGGAAGCALPGQTAFEIFRHDTMTDAFTTLSPVCVIPSPSRSSSPSSASIAISSSSSSSPSACGVSSGYNSSGVAGDYRVLSACDTSSPFPRARPDVVTARQDAVQQLHSSLQRLRARGWLHLTKEVEEVANAFTKSRPMDHLPVKALTPASRLKLRERYRQYRVARDAATAAEAFKIALHRETLPCTRRVAVAINFDTKMGHELHIVGSCASLGNWATDLSIPLQWRKGNWWVGEMLFNEFPTGTAVCTLEKVQRDTHVFRSRGLGTPRNPKKSITESIG
eukprot:GHVT01073558.1.p1 GENE.GHVT01073558.1~~GHVT01073558.1.p1  ORF type:complete len:362 (-),score=50.74 GHVT01073558.1:1710-2795(-)